MRIAVVSDIHGNDVALEAVLKDASTRGYDRLLDLGDTVSGPLRPLETFERMRSHDVVAIAGNHERQLLTLPPDQLNKSDAFTLDRLGKERVEMNRAGLIGGSNP
ncbi:metallophosphoesterase [Mesorhizobium sp. J428]|uniref:metallophosphoesterase family protein n=1 Tax=Mesorhizobium sp. J428 TaxID=2898440 RepID=UPI0021506D61|nr:metallophosphoesterase family protein [Mesorhizobium sp. J428]MCR5857209.1 metallophosphoesterase [Mesorhizobium sp. J428]